MKSLLWQARETGDNFSENPQQKSIDKTQRLLDETWTERAINSYGLRPTLPSVTGAHTSVGDEWRGPARRLMNKIFGGWSVQNTDDKKSRPLSGGKKYYYGGPY